jgi:AcrR family transcriptional regulator
VQALVAAAADDINCPVAQHSNRSNLLEGALHCLERLPIERVTARAIAQASGANLASIAYHFGSKDELVTEAAVAGLDRWLLELSHALRGEPAKQAPAGRLRRASGLLAASRQSHLGLARNYLSCLAMAQHKPRIRKVLANGFRRARPNVAALLGLGSDAVGSDAAGLLLAQFHGMLLQVLLDSALGIDGKRMQRAQERLGKLLLAQPTPEAPKPKRGARRQA